MDHIIGFGILFLVVVGITGIVGAITFKCSLTSLRAEAKEKKRKQDELEQAKKDRLEAAARERAESAARQQEETRRYEEELRVKYEQEKEWVETARALCEAKGANLFDALASKNVFYGLRYLRLDDLEKYWANKRLPEYWARRTVVYTDNFSTYVEYYRAWQLVGRERFSDEAADAFVKSAPSFESRLAVIKAMDSNLNVNEMLFADFSKEIQEQTTLEDIKVLKMALRNHPFGWRNDKYEAPAYAMVRDATLRVINTYQQVESTKQLCGFLQAAENLGCDTQEEYRERANLCEAICLKLLQLDPIGQLEYLTEDNHDPYLESPHRWVEWMLASLKSKDGVLAFQSDLSAKCQERFQYDINRRLVEIELQ